jgi:copper homeostasis protein
MTAFALEVAVTTVEDACTAAAAGADRLELCSALEVGGVTPSAALFTAVRDTVRIPVVALVRPRTGDFVYSDAEFAIMKRDAAWFLNNGAAAVVVGAVTESGHVDPRCAELAALKPAVFHRAFDCVERRAGSVSDGELEVLIRFGFHRVLTSGVASTALEGADRIADLVRAAAGRIEILPGGGITPDNVEELIRRTGCTQVHGSFRVPDRSTTLGMGDHRATDAEQVRRVKAVQARIASG